MTRDTPFEGQITTEDEFEDTLEHLLREAIGNDIDPRGSWVSRNGDGRPDLEVMILELSKPGEE